MHWIQILIETDAENHNHLESALQDLGALSVTLTDAGDEPLFEPDPGSTPVWRKLKVIGLFDANTPPDQLTQALQAYLSKSPPNYKIEILEDKDWIKEWMTQFKPIKFTDNLWICPSWHHPPDPSAANIMLDPGLAFGTGTHATTALCLQWLGAIDLCTKSIIDYGCGSGVLAIGALLLGCDEAWGIDIDPQALTATADNAGRNQIAANRIHISLPQDFTGQQTDILIANILAGPLVELAPELAKLIKTKGKIALSGILTSQTGQVHKAYQPWFEFEPVIEKDGWVLLIATKKD